jgi:hypothetical protein
MVYGFKFYALCFPWRFSDGGGGVGGVFPKMPNACENVLKIAEIY